jgi:hypothetical protein
MCCHRLCLNETFFSVDPERILSLASSPPVLLSPPPPCSCLPSDLADLPSLLCVPRLHDAISIPLGKRWVAPTPTNSTLATQPLLAAAGQRSTRKEVRGGAWSPGVCLIYMNLIPLTSAARDAAGGLWLPPGSATLLGIFLVRQMGWA